jgi:membrane protease YdiL (CAAX protease family)
MLKTLTKKSQNLLIVILSGGILNWLIYQFFPDYSGPITATLLFIVCTVLIKKSNGKWAEYGFLKPNKPVSLLWKAPMVMILTIVTGVLASKGFSWVFESNALAQTRFEGLEGNLPLFLLWVVIGWVVGGFFEEMIFRGFLLNNFEKLFGKNRNAITLAILSQAFIFGLAHFYNRGIVGGLTIFVVAIVLGILYIKFGRNLWPLIIAHGIIDTLSFLEDFLGV